MAVVINCTDEKGVVVCEHQQHFSGHSIRSVALAAVGQHFFFWIVSNGSSSPPSLFLPVSLLSLEDERHSHSAKWISPTCPYFNRISFIHFFWMGRYASVRHWFFFFFFFLSFRLSLLSLAFFIASCKREKRKKKNWKQIVHSSWNWVEWAWNRCINLSDYRHLVYFMLLQLYWRRQHPINTKFQWYREYAS